MSCDHEAQTLSQNSANLVGVLIQRITEQSLLLQVKPELSVSPLI